MINSPTHFLAKNIYHEVKEITKVINSHINNSFELRSKIMNVNLVDDHILFDEIINCTKFLFDYTYFTFDDKIYKQIFGTPMGFPISPLFADMVMDDLESDYLRILKDNHNGSPLFYYRYVDDTILCVQKKTC